MTFRRAEPGLKTIIERAVEAAMNDLRPGLRFAVNEVLVCEAAPHVLRIRSTLHFHSEGSPYCCGEPSCHLGVRRWAEVLDRLPLSTGMPPAVELHFEDVAAVYHAGVKFVGR
jgi:hypothetical protein